MKKVKFFYSRAIFFLAIAITLSSSQVRAQQCISTAIRATLNQHHLGGKMAAIKGEMLHYPFEVEEFYQSIGYEPVWLDERNVDDMILALRNSAFEGLLPDDYHLRTISTIGHPGTRTEVMSANLDILLTDAFFSLANHLWFGKSNPEIPFPDKWERAINNIDFSNKLTEALQYNSINIALDSLRPSTKIYYKLISALKSLHQDEGEKLIVPDGLDLEVGMEDSRIILVRQRLGAADRTSFCYDSVLYHKVIAFQSQRGLRPDGVIGKRTLAALNESHEVTIGRIKANLERCRWMPRDVGDGYVVINVPDFRLRLIAKDSTVLSMRAIVGRPDRSTPIFSSVISYLILNPTWTVPPTILKEDVLPAVKRDINYLARHNLKVIDKSGLEVDPGTLSWEKYTYRNFPYQIRQDPGTFNSMGLIKFQFSNRYKVFLHDTNARQLFSQSYRALSSGCIRIERPLELASVLLTGTRWTYEKLGKEITSGKTRTIVLDKPVPIYLEYFTMFPDSKGDMQTRDDVYGIDDVVLRAVETPLN